MSLIDQTARYWRMFRRVRVDQAAWFLRRLLPAQLPRRRGRPASLRHPLLVAAGLQRACPGTPELSFGEISRPLTPPLAWSPGDVSAHWRRELHAFDYLHWPALENQQKATLISDWIVNAGASVAEARDGEVVSRRLINWVQFIDGYAGDVPDAWCNSLLSEATWLRNNPDLHIRGIRLLFNATGLMFAGACLEGREGRQILTRGIEMFTEQLDEQLLADGGHYQRSIMLHCRALALVLDVQNLCAAQPSLWPQGFREQLAAAIESMTRFLERILAGDGQIPLFNDAVFDGAPAPEALFDYAERIAGFRRRPVPPTPVAVAENASGYYGYRAGSESLLIDCGALGPEYQPGHGHCDLLSFELVLQGHRIIVDSGTFGYEADEHRAYARSSQAHNTIIVNGSEQSEVWGRFAAGRRAKPGKAVIEEFDVSGMRFTGTHDGFMHLRQRVRHERHIDVDFGRQWVVSDHLSGSGDCIAEGYLNFAPGLTPRQQSDDVWHLCAGAQVVLEIRLLGGCKATSSITDYFPQYGMIEDKYTLRMTCSGSLPLEFGYRLIRR